MSVYLNKAYCKGILQITLATAIKKLNLISEIENKNSKKYKKLVEELAIINDIIKSINAYVDLQKTT